LARYGAQQLPTSSSESEKLGTSVVATPFLLSDGCLDWLKADCLVLTRNSEPASRGSLAAKLLKVRRAFFEHPNYPSNAF
jgi:hypothetical protein